MSKAKIVTLAVAALLNGTIAVEAFVDAPEHTIQTHFGVEIDASTIDRIGQEFEYELAQGRVMDSCTPGQGTSCPAGTTGRRTPGPRLPGRLSPLEPGGKILKPGSGHSGVYFCLTCT